MRNSQSHNFSARIPTGLTLALFVAGISLFCWPQVAKWLRSSSAESVTGRVDAQLVSSRIELGRTSSTPATMTRAIESLRVGDRVLAHNPEVSQAKRDSFVEPQWNEWLQLSLAMPKPDGSLLEIELLRPETWVREQMALVIARSEPKASSVASSVDSYSEHISTIASAPYSEHVSTIASPVAPHSERSSTIASPLALYSGRGVGGEGQTEAVHAPASDRTTGSLSNYEELVPYSPLRPIFRDLAFAGAELEISGKELQAIFVEMDLPELAITGPAIVHDIRNAPTVKPGAGRVITATFHHSSGDVIDLVVGESEPTALAAGRPEDSGLDRHDASQRNGSSISTTSVGASTNNIGTRVSFERPVLRSPAASAVGSQGTDQVRDSDTIGTTSNHPFWSVDRQEYVQAGQLAIGERLQTFSGDTKRVVSKLARPGPQPVYNLEVFAEHVYYVGKDGVLVHNSGQKYSGNGAFGRDPTRPEVETDYLYRGVSEYHAPQLAEAKLGIATPRGLIDNPLDHHRGNTDVSALTSWDTDPHTAIDAALDFGRGTVMRIPRSSIHPSRLRVLRPEQVIYEPTEVMILGRVIGAEVLDVGELARATKYFE